jgi:hypothetical protein
MLPLKKNFWGAGIPRERFLEIAARADMDDERFGRIKAVAAEVPPEPVPVPKQRSGPPGRPLRVGPLAFASVEKAREYFDVSAQTMNRALRSGTFAIRLDIPCAFVEAKQ